MIYFCINDLVICINDIIFINIFTNMCYTAILYPSQALFGRDRLAIFFIVSYLYIAAIVHAM